LQAKKNNKISRQQSLQWVRLEQFKLHRDILKKLFGFGILEAQSFIIEKENCLQWPWWVQKIVVNQKEQNSQVIG
jgi:hypothetical protein